VYVTVSPNPPALFAGYRMVCNWLALLYVHCVWKEPEPEMLRVSAINLLRASYPQVVDPLPSVMPVRLPIPLLPLS